MLLNNNAMLLDIAGRKVGLGQPCFIIAEAGVNHNGSLELGCRLIDAAAAAGADAVKFQTFDAKRLVNAAAPQADYQRKATGGEESQLQMLQRLQLSADDHLHLMQHCRDRQILFMSTPFDRQSADFLDQLDVPVLKIPSGEMTNLPFLDHVARLGRPLIVSTGMCNLGEVEQAVRTIEAAGNPPFVLLHCVSNYPADPADVNLRAMLTMQSAFGVPVGYSDHTLGTEVGSASVALGACVLEKHFTLDRTLPGPDHQASLEPAELAELVRAIRVVESALGSGRKVPVASEASTSQVARKSLVAACDLPVGSILCDDSLAIMRPGTGLPPSMKPYLIGRTTRVAIAAGELLALGDLA